MPEPELLLQLLVIALDPPAQLGKIDELGERDGLGQRGEPVLGRLLLVFRPFDQQPFLGSRLGEPFVAVSGTDADACVARREPGVIAFLFNTVILALCINLLAGLL